MNQGRRQGKQWRPQQDSNLQFQLQLRFRELEARVGYEGIKQKTQDKV